MFDLYVWILFAVFLGIFCAEECSFNNGKCTYEIKLTQPNTYCETQTTKRRNIGSDPYNQNDNEMTKMQRDFHTVTEQHKNRIEELEASVQKLLRSAVPPPVDNIQMTSRRTENDNIELKVVPFGNSNHTETGLMKKLYDEFSSLRKRLFSRTSQLLETEKKLNETTTLFAKSQEELLDQGDKLLIAEHKVATLEQERYILKNKVKHTTESFTELQIKFNTTDAKMLDLENQLYTVVRSESNLKEELGYFQWKLSNAEKSYTLLQANYSALELKLNKTKQTLERTEFQLMECITAKTQSFCGFEDDKLCGYEQDDDDDFDWIRHVGRTASSGTGPETDHTCGEPRSGHYMYIEASGRHGGQKAILVSPKYRGVAAQCLAFYYHMHGTHVGTLNVYTSTDGETELNSVWRAYGNQGNVWIKATLSIPKELARTGYRVKFEAVTRRGYQGDISIDDITVDDGKCPDGAVQVKYDKNITDVDNHYFQRYKRFKNKINRKNG